MAQKYEIKNRFTGEVLFSCDIPEVMESGMIARHALETDIDDGANLRGAKNAPAIISGLRWTVHISGTGMMRIGCQNHSVEVWKDFTDKEIKSMDRDALEFWNKYKTMLLVACDTHVHVKESEA